MTNRCPTARPKFEATPHAESRFIADSVLEIAKKQIQTFVLDSVRVKLKHFIDDELRALATSVTQQM